MSAEPRHVYVISFDAANTDLKYFCSHSDIGLDGIDADDIFYGDLIEPSTYSQTLDPINANATIGKMSFGFLDKDQSLTAMLNAKLLVGKTISAKRVQHYLGERGEPWASYTLHQTHQVFNSIGRDWNSYTFDAQDIQRSMLEDVFDPIITNLTASVSKTGITIPVNSTTGIDLIVHGASYSDAPNATVLYLAIDDEIIRCSAKTSTAFTVDNASSTLDGGISVGADTVDVVDAGSFDSSGIGYIDNGSGTITEIRWTGKSTDTLTGVTGVINAHSSGNTIVNSKGRGVLNTLPQAYDVDVSQPVSNRTQVAEHIYYELPAMKLAYAILTGTLYGSANTLPDHHHLDIDSTWVSTSAFTSIGSDIWDPSDDTAGIIFSFSGLKKANAKKFIEEQLNFFCGVFNPILPTGELGLQRMTGVLNDAAYTRVLDESGINRISSVHYDLGDIHNIFKIKWNYDVVQDTYTRTTGLVDTDSSDPDNWNASKTLEVESLGLKGHRHTDAIIGNFFNVWRSRYAGPPFKATVVLKYIHRDIKVGEIVRLSVKNLPDFTQQQGVFGSLDMSVEVQRVSINHRTGDVTIAVFGSTYKAAPLALGSDASPMEDSFFTSEGTDISTVLTGTVSGGGSIFTVTASGSLTGVADLNSATAAADNSQGIFYWDGDLTIQSGVQIDISDNVEIRWNGFLTNNGAINGKGRGIAASTNGTGGGIGNSHADGGVTLRFQGGGKVSMVSSDKAVVAGANAVLPQFLLTNNGGTSISGKPSDLRGSSGGQGGAATTSYDGYFDDTMPFEDTENGGAGGNGGAGLLLIGKGGAGGVSSSINLSGNDGVAGTVTDDYQGLATRSGSGGGGAAGALVFSLVGNAVTQTVTDYLVANNGITPGLGVTAESPSLQPTPFSRYKDPRVSYYRGTSYGSAAQANLLVTYMPDNQAAVAKTTVPAGVTLLYKDDAITTGLTIEDDGGVRFDKKGIDGYDSNGDKTVDIKTDGSFDLGSLASEKNISFDPAAGLFEVGRNVEMLGMDAYENQSLYYHTFFDGLGGFTQDIVGSATIVDTSSFIRMGVGQTISGSARLRKSVSYNLDSVVGVASNICRFKIRISPHAAVVNCTWKVGMGDMTDDGELSFGFTLLNGALYGNACDSSSETTVDLDINAGGAPFLGDGFLLEAILLPGVGVYYYVDDELEGVITSGLPSVFPFIPLFDIYGIKTSTDSDACYLDFGELRLLINKP